jgi:hypothetical protein
MKIDTDTLSYPVQEEKVEPLEPEVPYKKEEVTPYLSDPSYLAMPRITEFAASRGYSIVSSIKDALIARQAKKKCLSIREADTAARGELQIDSQRVWDVISTFSNNETGVLLLEDVAGAHDSVFELRAYYNRGIVFFSSGKSKTKTPEELQRATAEMDKILDMLDWAGVPAWPEEVKNGFPVELCKPDFMTWSQYEERKKAGGKSDHDWEAYRREKEYAADDAKRTEDGTAE